MTALARRDIPTFLSWVGGKRKLLSEICSRLPDDFMRRRYCEPFLGGGAVFFALQPKHALLADANKYLIGAYAAIRYVPDGVIAHLEPHVAAHSKKHYYGVRELLRSGAYAPDSPAGAALFLYLNKTCFNGLWREGPKGFNVPWGDRPDANIFDAATIRAASEALQTCDIRPLSYRDSLATLGVNDFVYMDPPYVPEKPSSFTKYVAGGFTEQDHVDLATACRGLHTRGAKFMLSNSDTARARELYDGFRIETISSSTSVGATAARRGKKTEILVRNY